MAAGSTNEQEAVCTHSPHMTALRTAYSYVSPRLARAKSTLSWLQHVEFVQLDSQRRQAAVGKAAPLTAAEVAKLKALSNRVTSEQVGLMLGRLLRCCCCCTSGSGITMLAFLHQRAYVDMLREEACQRRMVYQHIPPFALDWVRSVGVSWCLCLLTRGCMYQLRLRHMRSCCAAMDGWSTSLSLVPYKNVDVDSITQVGGDVPCIKLLRPLLQRGTCFQLATPSTPCRVGRRVLPPTADDVPCASAAVRSRIAVATGAPLTMPVDAWVALARYCAGAVAPSAVLPVAVVDDAGKRVAQVHAPLHRAGSSRALAAPVWRACTIACAARAGRSLSMALHGSVLTSGPHTDNGVCVAVPSSADPASANEALSAACATIGKSETAGNMSVRLLQVGKQQVAVTCSIDGVVANSASGVRGGVLAGLPVRRRGWVGGSHTIAAWYQQRNPGRPAIVVGRSECALHRGWESFTVSEVRATSVCDAPLPCATVLTLVGGFRGSSSLVGGHVTLPSLKPLSWQAGWTQSPLRWSMWTAGRRSSCLPCLLASSTVPLQQ